MKNIAIATFAVLIVVLSLTSGHIALAYNSKFIKMFSNSGNNQETQQECGNSCTVTSSNTITFGSSGLTTPSPSPTPTSLILNGGTDCFGDSIFGLMGFLKTNTGSPVAGATITFTGFNLDAMQNIPIHSIISTFPMNAVTSGGGCFQVQLSSQATNELTTSFNNITAHYAGSAAFGASNSNTISPSELIP